MIAVCMLAWNKHEYTKNLLDGIRRHSGYFDVGFYFVDNGSTDGITYNLLGSYSPRYLERSETNDYLSKQYNKLMRAAFADNPDVLLLVNNDMLVMPNWLSPVMREVEKDDNKHYVLNFEEIVSRPFTTDMADVLRFEEAARLKAIEYAGQTTSSFNGVTQIITPKVAKLVTPIPEQFKIWYCDTYMQWQLDRHGIPSEAIMDAIGFHYGSVSVNARDKVHDIIDDDHRSWRELMRVNNETRAKWQVQP